jgi:chromosome segregation ATPase
VISSLREKLDAAQLNASKMQTEQEAKAKQLLKEKSQLEYQIQQINVQIDAHKETINEMKIACAELEAERNNLRQVVETQAMDQDTLQKEKANFEKERAKAAKALEANNQQIKELEKKGNADSFCVSC